MAKMHTCDDYFEAGGLVSAAISHLPGISATMRGTQQQAAKYRDWEQWA
jgi:hypothetical protein